MLELLGMYYSFGGDILAYLQPYYLYIYMSLTFVILMICGYEAANGESQEDMVTAAGLFGFLGPIFLLAFGCLVYMAIPLVIFIAFPIGLGALLHLISEKK